MEGVSKVAAVCAMLQLKPLEYFCKTSVFCRRTVLKLISVVLVVAIVIAMVMAIATFMIMIMAMAMGQHNGQ